MGDENEDGDAGAAAGNVVVEARVEVRYPIGKRFLIKATDNRYTTGIVIGHKYGDVILTIPQADDDAEKHFLCSPRRLTPFQANLHAQPFDGGDELAQETFSDVTQISQKMLADNGHQNQRNVDDGRWAKEMYEQQMMVRFQFTGKWPMSPQQYYEYSAKMRVFNEDHNHISERKRLNEILRGVSDSRRTDFQHHRKTKAETKWNKYLEDHPIANEDQRAQRRKQYVNEKMTELYTTVTLEQYLIGTLHIKLNEYAIHKILECIKAQRNEHPAATMRKAQRYVEEIEALIKRLNEVWSDPPIPTLTEQAKVNVYKRIFVWENNNPDFKNRSKLNEKVRCAFNEAFRDWGAANEAVTTLKIEQKATEIGDKVLRKADETATYKWILCDDDVPSIFMLSDANAEPPTKRLKLNDGTVASVAEQPKNEPRKLKCNYGRNRQYEKRKHELENDPNESDADESANESTNDHADDDDMRNIERQKQQAKCTRGQQCQYWQEQNCHFSHKDMIMHCGHCGKRGHPMAICRDLQRQLQAHMRNTYNAGQSQQQRQYQIYNPRLRLNPTQDRREQNPNAHHHNNNNAVAQHMTMETDSTGVHYHYHVGSDTATTTAQQNQQQTKPEVTVAAGTSVSQQRQLEYHLHQAQNISTQLAQQQNPTQTRAAYQNSHTRAYRTFRNTHS